MPFQYQVVEVDQVNNSFIQPTNVGAGDPGETAIDKDGADRATNGNLYIPLGPGIFAGQFDVYRSTDNGVTWTIPGTNIVCRCWASHFDAATQKYFFAYQDSINPGANAPILLAQYDIATETMSTIVAAGSPSTTGVFSVRVRSNGDIVVFHYDVTAGPPGQYNYSIWNGAAWTTVHFDVQGTAQAKTMSTAIDSNDDIHIIVSFSAGVAYNVNYWHLSHLNVLAGPQQFLWVTAIGMDQRGVPKIAVSNPSDTVFILNDNGNDNTMRVFFGSPRTAPVFNSLVAGLSIGATGGTLSQVPYTYVGPDDVVYCSFNYINSGGNPEVAVFTAPASNPTGPWTKTIWLTITNVPVSTNPQISVVANAVSPKISVQSKPQLYFNAFVFPFGPGPMRFTMGLQFPPSGTRIIPPPVPIPLPDPCCVDEITKQGFHNIFYSGDT